jgi:metallophosphoesterase (TIGR00282 family)
MTRILFFGDVVGGAGRNLLLENVERIAARLSVDFVVVNAENAAHGFGITVELAAKFFARGIDVLTAGDHAWDQSLLRPGINSEPRLLRPENYTIFRDGAGHGLFRARNGKRVLVLCLLGTLFMARGGIENPFYAADAVLEKYKLGRDADAIFVDFHAEATSEKMSLAHYLDGRVTAVVGTHTHIPTADARVLSGGTAYMTDAGMCGDFDTSIGMKKEASLARFLGRDDGERLSPGTGPGTLCGVVVDVGGDGLAVAAEPFVFGANLKNTHPSLAVSAEAEA